MKNTDFIIQKMRSKKGQIAVLIDPEDTHEPAKIDQLVEKSEFAGVDYFFVGGSTVSAETFKKTCAYLKSKTATPVVIFPGDHQQLANEPDAILYLSLLSGRNPEYLIGQHVKSAQDVYQLNMELIPTAYILINGEKTSSVAYVSQTTPIPPDQQKIAVNTALAGVFQGKKAVYFDAGSGASKSVEPSLIEKLNKMVDVVSIVGGGIRTIEEIQQLAQANTNVIVIGNKIEEDVDFLLDIKNYHSAQKL